MTCPPIDQLLDASSNSHPSEGQRAATHLDTCAACRGRLTQLAAFEGRLSHALTARAGLAEPSPRAWSRLRATLEEGARPASPRLPWRSGRAQAGAPFTPRGDQAMRKKLAGAALGLIVLGGSLVLAAPTIAAQVGGTFKPLALRLTGADGRSAVLSGGVEPGYLPEGFARSPVLLGVNHQPAGAGGGAFSTQLYRDGERFVSIELHRSGESTLPAGKRLSLRGSAAILEEGLSGSLPGGSPADRVEPAAAPITIAASGTPPPGLAAPLPAMPPITPLRYSGARRLTWYSGAGDERVKVEILANLSEAEIVKIAEALISRS